MTSDLLRSVGSEAPWHSGEAPTASKPLRHDVPDVGLGPAVHCNSGGGGGGAFEPL